VNFHAIRSRVELGLAHRADLDLAVKDRIALFDSAQGLGGQDHFELRGLFDVVHVDGAGAYGVKLEDGFGRCRLGRPGGIGKGDSAGHEALERTDPQRSVEEVPEVQIDAAGVPEQAVRADQLVIGLVDQNLDVEAGIVLCEVEFEDLSDLEAVMVNRGRDMEGPQFVRLQAEPCAGLEVKRWLAQPLEGPLPFSVPGLYRNIGAGDQGAEAGDPGQADFRADHPELCSFVQMVFDLLGHGGVNDGEFQVLADIDRVDGPGLDALVHDLGLAGFEAFGGLEGDRDARALVTDCFVGDPSSDDRHGQGNHPDDGEAPGWSDLGLWVRALGGWFGGAVTHDRTPGDPISGADRTILQRRLSG
jgi:hypothetical protein